jgi:hypothetical protein
MLRALSYPPPLAVIPVTLEPKREEVEREKERKETLDRILEERVRDRSTRSAERQERDEFYTNMQNDLRRAMAGGRPVPRDPGEMRLDLLRRIHAREVQIIAELRERSPN